MSSRRPVFTEVVKVLPEGEFAHAWKEKFGVVEVEDKVLDGRHPLLDVIERVSPRFRRGGREGARAHQAEIRSTLS